MTTLTTMMRTALLMIVLAGCGDDSTGHPTDLAVELLDQAIAEMDLSPACQPKPLSFSTATAITFPAMSGPAYLVAADFDGDHKLDFAVSNYKTSTVSVLHGNGDGSFTGPDNYVVGNATTHDVQGLGTGDFTGDGVLDLVVVNTTSNTLTVLKGTGAGKFAAVANPHATGIMPEGLVVADFNHDSKLDVALALDDRTLDVLLGDGSGGFSTRLPASTPLAAAGDFNADGKLDIVGAAFDDADMASGHSANIVLGNGDGSFTLPGASYAVGSGPDGVAVGDFNSDHHLDLVVTSFYDHGATVLLGNGDGTFTIGTTLSAGSEPDGVALGNLDCDANLDLVVANAGSGDNTVSIFHGNGDGTFAAAIPVPAGSGPGATVVGDFNGDGRADILVTNYEADTVTLLTNTP